jgi:hypothetical protein
MNFRIRLLSFNGLLVAVVIACMAGLIGLHGVARTKEGMESRLRNSVFKESVLEHVPNDIMLPAVDIMPIRDQDGSWVLHLHVENFEFAQNPRVDESLTSGSLYLYVDGERHGTATGPVVALDGFGNGRHVITVGFLSPRGNPYLYKGKLLLYTAEGKATNDGFDRTVMARS